MVLGAFGRILLQVTFVAGGVVGRAVVQAYKDAIKRGVGTPGAGGMLRRRMSLLEASRILEVDPSKASQQELRGRFERLWQLNERTDNFLGSPYIQQRVDVARILLEEEICKKSRKPGATNPPPSDAKGAKTPSSDNAEK